MSHSLPNYLRGYRRRAGLSQTEVAYLVGCKDGSKVCRHERGTREPSLRIAIAYEVISGQPIRELFRGVYEEVERSATRRARILAQRKARKALTSPKPRTRE